MNLQVRHKESLCNVDSDNMRNRRPGTDCEQNSLRYFYTAKGGCHIARDGGKGGWAACRGCLAGAAPGYEVPKLECGSPCLHQLLLQRNTTVKCKACDRKATVSHRPPTDRELQTGIATGVTRWLDFKSFLILSS